MADPVISVRGLHKAYGSVEAVRGIDLEVQRGEIFAFLGPNGAGKTTIVEILEGYRERSDGEVSVLGVDPASAPLSWRARIGVVLQSSQVEAELTVREVLELYAGYYSEPRPVDEVLDLVGLREKADARGGRLSGGQQRRVDVALALVGDPELVFMDEPTTGFDPSARRAAWDMVAGLRDLGKTIFLTTHYMDEAEHLADRIAVLDGGRIVAEGTPGSLGGRDRAEVEMAFSLPGGVALNALPGAVHEAGPRVDHAGRVTLRTPHTMGLLHALSGWALEGGHELHDLSVSRPTLEDVYLELTRQAEGEHAPVGAAS